MGVESLVGLRPLLEDSILVRLHRRNRARHRAARLHCGQADLILRDGTFYLYATLEVADVPTIDVDNFLGSGT